jgi:endonuclease/exonuclease/phosphatase family metal-dependent hydrolase
MKESENFKIVTYNIHRGLSTLRKRSIIEKLAKVMNSSAADILCLQEVFTPKMDTKPLLEDFAENIWAYRAYGKNALFPNGNQGNAVLARQPIISHKNIDLTHGLSENRGALTARISFSDGKELTVINTHLGLGKKEKRYQVDTLKNFIFEYLDPSDPVILAGDFNDWTGSFEAELCDSIKMKDAVKEKHGKNIRTFPSVFPLFNLDRIFYRRLNLLNSRVLSGSKFKGLSDHLPVEAHFSI